MANMNVVILEGRLTKDPETKTFDKTSVCIWSLAVDGYKENETYFVNCKAWNKTGEFVQKFFTKGQKMFLSGSLETGKYDKDGTTRSFFNVVVNKARFGEKKNIAEDIPDNPFSDDDIPF